MPHLHFALTLYMKTKLYAVNVLRQIYLASLSTKYRPEEIRKKMPQTPSHKRSILHVRDSSTPASKMPHPSSLSPLTKETKHFHVAL